MQTNEKKNRRTAVITGASRGLGAALARELARQGWQLVINARGAEALRQVERELVKLTTVRAFPGDITDAEHRREMARAAEELGGTDVLINNAGMLGPSPQPKLRDYPLETLERVYETNVAAQLGMIQMLLPTMPKGARILNITSDAAREPYEGWGGYGSSKAALEQFSAILAAEEPELRVYAVDPGDMRTTMHQQAFPGEDISDRPLPEESVPGIMRLLTEDIPSGRYSAGASATEDAGTTGTEEATEVHDATALEQ